MISLQYAISKKDYINFFTYIMWDAPENRKKKTIYYTKQIVPLVIFILAFYFTGIFDRDSKFILLILGFIFLTSLLSLIGVRTNTMRQAEKFTDNPVNSSIFLPFTMVISVTGISIKSALIESKYQWNSFIKKQESEEYYFLFTSSVQAIIIPKKVFEHTEQRLQFEKLLSQQLSFDAEIGHLIKS